MNGYIQALEGDPAELLASLAQNGVFPSDATWWFAWNEGEIVLPRPLFTANNPADNRWDVARVFSEKAELRLARVGGRRGAWLLTEDLQAAATLPAAGELESFRVNGGGHRILWGGDLNMRGQTEHGLVRFPRPLDYGVSTGKGQRLVADVVLYLDEFGAVRTARYRALKVVYEGAIQAPKLPRTDGAPGGVP
jgi:hypothetical protein